MSESYAGIAEPETGFNFWVDDVFDAFWPYFVFDVVWFIPPFNEFGTLILCKFDWTAVEPLQI